MTEYCDMCSGRINDHDSSVLCPTCLRFARLAREQGYADSRDAFIALEQAMLDGAAGFLASNRWLSEEIAVLDKAYTLSGARQRMKWSSLARSFRGVSRLRV